MINVGFIGTGGICGLHANDIISRPDLFSIKAASDINTDNLNRIHETYGITELYTDYQKLLTDPDIDAVLVAVPHDLHVQICIDAFEAKKHVLVEKPIARTLEEADKIILSSDKAQKVLLVGHNERYLPSYAKIKNIIDDGLIGHIFSAKTDHFQDFNPPAQSWWRNAEKVGGGCVIGSGIHRLDLLLWYLGDVDEVFAHQTFNPERLEAEVLCNASIKFKSGTISDFFCNWGTFKYMYNESLALYGEKGLVYYDGNVSNTLTIGLKNVDEGALKTKVCPTVETQWEHFADCIINGAKPLIGGQESRKSLELVLAIYESARIGKPVRMKMK